MASPWSLGTSVLTDTILPNLAYYSHHPLPVLPWNLSQYLHIPNGSLEQRLKNGVCSLSLETWLKLHSMLALHLVRSLITWPSKLTDHETLREAMKKLFCSLAAMCPALIKGFFWKVLWKKSKYNTSPLPKIMVSYKRKWKS